MLGLNIGKNATTPIERAADDYLTCLDGVYPHADYVTVNISSPNTANLRALQQDSALDALLGRIAERREQLAQRHGRRCPSSSRSHRIWTSAQLAAIAALLKTYGARCGAFGVIAANTTLSRDARAGSCRMRRNPAGCPGRRCVAQQRVTARLRAALGPGFPVIGVGGIDSGRAALEKLRRGRGPGAALFRADLPGARARVATSPRRWRSGRIVQSLSPPG